MPTLKSRKTPTQERSRARVERILDAAALILSRDGREALNTNRIAEEAAVPVGSVYQFFPNKEAVIHAVAVRTLDRLDRLVANLVPNSGFDWQTLVDRFVDDAAAFWSSELGLHAVSAILKSEEDNNDRRIAKRIAPLLGSIAPRLSPMRRLVVASVVIKAIGPVLYLSQERGARRAIVIEEAKNMVKGYLQWHRRRER